MIPVVISGGSGTRLWPESRVKWPKQFSHFFKPSLQAQAIQRASLLGDPWVVTGADLKVLTERTFSELKISKYQRIYEPFGRNTAPAIALLCQVLKLQGQEKEIVGVFPADQMIEKEKVFLESVELAIECAKKNKIVTLGIHPSYPAIGYGYIHAQKEVFLQHRSQTAFGVEGFREKPNAEQAQEFIDQGCFFWNAGIFIFTAQKMIDLFDRLCPTLWKEISTLKEDHSNLKEIYSRIKAISIDYAIMEKLTAQDLVCIPCDMGWSDVGSWDAIAEIKKNHENKNVVSVSANDNQVFSESKKVYAFLGVNDLIVVDTPDAQLIVKKGQTQNVREVVEQVEKIAPLTLKEHSFEERPWGRFEILKETNHFKTKAIDVLPGVQLSYQSHQNREEFWIVVQGKGEVVLDDKIIPVQKGSAVHIEKKSKHRIRNTGGEVLQFVEVQLGTYFGEDDIVRYQDDFGRMTE